MEKKENDKKYYHWEKNHTWIVIGVILTALTAGIIKLYDIGKDNGQTHYDESKAQMERDNNQLIKDTANYLQMLRENTSRIYDDSIKLHKADSAIKNYGEILLLIKDGKIKL